jgi:hypothetical protein
MKHWYKLVLGLAAVAACVLVGGVAFAATSGKSHAKSPVVRQAPAVKPSAKGRSLQVKKAKVSRAKSTSRSSGARENTAGDPDNVQSGDQTTPDTPGDGEQSQSESAPDNEQGQSGEPAQGHEDPPGGVNHECTGGCQE